MQHALCGAFDNARQIEELNLGALVLWPPRFGSARLLLRALAHTSATAPAGTSAGTLTSILPGMHVKVVNS